MIRRMVSQGNGRPRRLSGRGSKLLLSALAAALVAGVIGPIPAHAHADLTSANPAPNSIATAVVTQVQLSFSQPVILFGDGVTVSNGIQVIKTTPSISGTTVTAVLANPVGAGSYDVTWNIESTDGHRVTASYPFSVAAGVVAPVTAPGTLPTTVPPTTTAPAASTAVTARPSTAATELTAPSTTSPADTGAGDTVPNWALYAIGAILIVALAAAAGAIARGIQKKRRQTGA